MAKKKVKSKPLKQSSPVAKPPVLNTNHEEVIAAALSNINPPILIKVCRLCETKDGPFLNIFDSDKSTAKKIEELMPFGIAEYDDLPHKICFRCSAKVEELHEFVQKCVRTQKSLHEALGKKPPLFTKNKLRMQWEEKLNKSNITNDDICDALIKKAMEGIKNIPLNSTHLDNDDKPLRSKRSHDSDVVTLKKDGPNDQRQDFDPDVNLKNLRLSIEKCDNNMKASVSNTKSSISNKKITSTSKTSKDTPKNQNQKNEDSDSSEEEKKAKEPQSSKTEKQFNIMDFVTTIKVNSVGILFQCKLCNRNFLKKEVVENHGCAKTGVPKIDLTVNLPPPEPPKPANTVKYIKIDNNKKPSANKTELESKKVAADTPVEKPKSLKPKIGPASKVKKYVDETKAVNESQKDLSEKNSDASEINLDNTSATTVAFPKNPNPNILYKLVPGPNNTFTLVSGPPTENDTTQKLGKKRKASDENVSIEKKDKKPSPIKNKSKPSSEEVIDLETEPDDGPPVIRSPAGAEKPYPVGLFQTRAHHSTTHPLASTSVTPTFTTPAMKKQSYTVVQTGNPSKLVISTKSTAPVEEVPKKRPRKNKIEENPDAVKEPYNVTIEDVTPSKEPAFFTFINVDPLLQPSYVLPTDNIIQESQISTSTPAVKNKSDSKDKYACNMCGEGFSREKKLLSHIQSHYSKMDEEDKLREKKSSKKKGKKS